MMVGFSGEGSRSMFAILDTYIGRPAHLGSHQSCNKRREDGDTGDTETVSPYLKC